MTDIRISQVELLKFATAIFTASGMSTSDAAIVADVLVWANELGVDSHGVARMPIYLKEIARGEFDAKGQPTLQPLLPATFKLECKRTAGPVCMMKAVEHAIDIADKFGVGVGLLSEPTHLGAVGRYAQMIALLAALAMVSASEVTRPRSPAATSISTRWA